MEPGSKHDSLGFSGKPERKTERVREEEGKGEGSLETFEHHRRAQDGQSISLVSRNTSES